MTKWKVCRNCSTAYPKSLRKCVSCKGTYYDMENDAQERRRKSEANDMEALLQDIIKNGPTFKLV